MLYTAKIEVDINENPNAFDNRQVEKPRPRLHPPVRYTVPMPDILVSSQRDQP
jgi:hypothetical protein